MRLVRYTEEIENFYFQFPVEILSQWLASSNAQQFKYFSFLFLIDSRKWIVTRREQMDVCEDCRMGLELSIV